MKNSIIVERNQNPSSDFFVYPYLKINAKKIKRYNDTDTPPERVPPDTSIIFVRYISTRWQRWVEQHRSKLTRVVFFMDDDLFDWQAHRQLPARYRFRLYWFSFRYQAWLKSTMAELWVSTPWLAQKYTEWQPVLLSPYSPHEQASVLSTVFYHGSASHQAEINWLYPVFEQVLKQDPSLCVELIGSHSVKKRFSALPRVHVLHPMGWPAYQALLCRPGRTIGLAPLLDNPFNAARAPTKFFDITQAGAVGIYANHPVYRSIVEHGHNGLLLPMEQQAWVNAILELSNNEEQRQVIWQHAKLRCAGPASKDDIDKST